MVAGKRYVNFADFEIGEWSLHRARVRHPKQEPWSDGSTREDLENTKYVTKQFLGYLPSSYCIEAMSVHRPLQRRLTHVMFQRLDNVPCLPLDHRELSLRSDMRTVAYTSREKDRH